MSVLDLREYQRFPTLTGAQIRAARRFASGPETRFTPGEVIYRDRRPGRTGVAGLAGSIEVVRRDGLTRVAPRHDPWSPASSAVR